MVHDITVSVHSTLMMVFHLPHRCLCLNDAERWTAQQLLDHSFLKPPSPKNLPQSHEASPEGDVYIGTKNIQNRDLTHISHKYTYAY